VRVASGGWVTGALSRLRLESVVDGGGNAAEQVHFKTDLAITLLSDMELLDVVPLDEVIASDSAIVGRSEIGAWSRT
jgi:hypothetical protein